MNIKVSAPGKLMLFGDHAVIHGRPCIVTAMNQRIFVTVEDIDGLEFQLDAPDVDIANYKKNIADLGKGDIPKGARFAEIAIKNILELRSKNEELRRGVKITTKSEFSSQFGFGSSSAITVCVVKATSELLRLTLSNKEIFDIAYKTVLDIQGDGSGFDIAAGIYGGTVYYVRGGKILEPLAMTSLPLVVGYSGIKADTVTVMQQVRERFKHSVTEEDRLYSEIGLLVDQAKEALLKNDFVTVGTLMNKNHIYLQQLGVSIPKLDAMIDASLQAGAYGAKLSGAGGGDCMIALVAEDKKHAVEVAIEKAGGQVLHVLPNAEGIIVIPTKIL